MSKEKYELRLCCDDIYHLWLNDEMYHYEDNYFKVHESEKSIVEELLPLINGLYGEKQELQLKYDNLKKLYLEKDEELYEFMEDTQNLLLKNNRICVDRIVDFLDRLISENKPLTLTEKWKRDCEYKHTCRENHEYNVASMSRHTLLLELKKRLENYEI